MRRLLLPSFIALCIVGLTAPRLGARQVQAPAGFPAVGAPPAVTLLTAGAAPRKALRINIPNGHREQMTMDTTMTAAIDVAGMSMPMSLPTMRVVADLAVTAVSAAGDMTVATTFSDVAWVNDPGTDPNMLEMLKGMSGDIKGLTATSVMTPRAMTRETKFDTSKITNPQLSQAMAPMQSMMQNVSLPLPEEAVGVGATWEVRMSVDAQGMQTFNKYAVKLTALDEKSCTLTVSFEQTAPSQSISNPAMPAGTSASLDSLSGSGTGTVTIQFDALSPKSEMNTNTKTNMSMGMGGQTQAMSMAMTMKLKVTPGVVK